MQEMYVTDSYEQHNPTWHEEDAGWKAGHVAAMIRKNGLAPESIREVGCGTGEILLELERQFPDVTLSGYEIAPRAYERAALKSTARTSFHLEDLLRSQVPPADVLLAADVLEHVDDPIGFASGLRDRATYKIFHIPLDLSAQSVARATPILGLRRSVGHIHYFFKDTALALLEDCGYTVIDWFYTASRLELPNQARSSRLMRIPRRIAFRLAPDLTVRVLGGFSLMVLAK